MATKEAAAEPATLANLTTKIETTAKELSSISTTLEALTRIYGSGNAEYTSRVEKEARSLHKLGAVLGKYCTQINNIAIEQEKKIIGHEAKE